MMKLTGLCTIFALIFGSVEAGKRSSINQNIITEKASTRTDNIQKLQKEIQELSQRAQEISPKLGETVSPDQIDELQKISVQIQQKSQQLTRMYQQKAETIQKNAIK